MGDNKDYAEASTIDMDCKLRNRLDSYKSF